MIPIIDPEFQSLIPPLTKEERSELENSLKKDGCRDALILWNQTLLDGHNRLEICQQNDISFDTKSYGFSSRDEAKVWILRNQLARRNLTPYQRAELALRLEGVFKAQAKERQREHGGTAPGQPRTLTQKSAEVSGESRVALAKSAGVSHDTIAKVKKIAERAPEKVKEELRSGNVSINQAYKDIVKEERKSEIAQERLELAKTGAAIAPSDRWSVSIGDIRTWETTKQYDFIITDPPYPKEFLPLYGSLAVQAMKWLRPGGLLIAMCGQSYLDEIYSILCHKMEYYWTACYLTPGQPTPLRQVNVNTTWKPLLIYGNGEYKGKIFGDVFKSDGNDKDFHKWGQSKSGMFDIISKICLPGQKILDPFCGAGTTGVAALRHGCFFDGIDIDKQNVNIAKGRLDDTTEERRALD